MERNISAIARPPNLSNSKDQRRIIDQSSRDTWKVARSDCRLRSHLQTHVVIIALVLSLVTLPRLLCPSYLFVEAYNYQNYGNNNNDNYSNTYSYNNDASAASNDDAAAAAGDDAVAAAGDDAAAAGDDANAGNNQTSSNGSGDDVIANKDDDEFQWKEGMTFDDVSLMPVSCINYNNGHMIKFQFFESTNNLQCHTKNLGTFVVSIAHYMRAYFNYQALIKGQDFSLPSDASYLNCVMLQETTYSQQKLYAKIGCMERETFTSTKLKLHVYTDNTCSVPYDDGQSDTAHARNGYDINGYIHSTKVSFRPPFYSCLTCKQSHIASSFSKQGTYWYDDDAQSNGGVVAKNDDIVENDVIDDYFKNDDKYYHVQQSYINNQQLYAKDDDDAFYVDDDSETNNGGRTLRTSSVSRTFTPISEIHEVYEAEFWNEFERDRRELSSNGEDASNSTDVGNWNMCNRVYRYGVWCDEECRALDTFRVDEWSKSDIFLLCIMCVFMAAMMLLIFAKRVKAYEKATLYGDELDITYPGLPPMAMALLFVLIMTVITVLANLRLVNETLVFAVVTCILLFIYMLKLTLFETRSPGLLLPPSSERRRGKDVDVDNYSFTGNPLFNY